MHYLSLLLLLGKGFKFQLCVCNGCHDVLMMSVNLSNIAILTIYGVDYCYIITEITKHEAIKVMQNIDLTETDWNIIKHKNILSHIKMGREILTFVDIEIEKHKYFRYKNPIFLEDVDINNVFLLVKKTLNTFLDGCMIIINISHYI